jgi:streptogrisin C
MAREEFGMDKRKLVRWGSLAVAAAATVAVATVTLPALAGVNQSRTGGAQERAAGDQLGAMQADLGLTAQQAAARLAKEAWATGTVARLRTELGTAYAGAWLTADAGELMVGVTSAQAAGHVRAAGAQPKLMARNEADLAALQRRLDSNATRDNDGVTGWHVDVATNAIVVTARPDAARAAQSLIAASGMPAGSTRVVVADESPVPLFDLRGGDAFSINGQGRCSVGFSVQGGFVTAGHCGRPGNATNGFNNAPQGTFRASSFPGNDFAFVQVNNNWTPRAVVATVRAAGNNQQGNRQRVVNVNVAGSQEAPVGASVCRTGSTTGTRCGVVQAKNATVRYPEGVVNGLTRTNACAEPGDSGGPFLSGNQAQGLTSGGSGNCRAGGVTFFQPINEVLATNRLRLVTANQGGGQNTASPTAPPSSAAPSATPSKGAADPSGSARPRR